MKISPAKIELRREKHAMFEPKPVAPPPLPKLTKETIR